MNNPTRYFNRASLAAAVFLGGYASVLAATYDFNSGVPGGAALAGHAQVFDSGSLDGTGFLSLTEALGSQNGGFRFPGPVASVHELRFKARVRLADGTYPPADGFSLTVSSDLPPAATYGNPESGHNAASPTPRFILAFDTYNNGAPDFIGLSVIVDGATVATHPLAVDELPLDWFELEAELTRAGRVSVWLDGAKVIDDVATDFAGIANAVAGLDARTGGSYSTHWFDDVELDLGEAAAGPAGIGAESEIASDTIVENTPHRFAAAPAGAGPFTYQWFRNGAALEGKTGRVLRLAGALADAGSYSVTISNASGQATSSPAVLAITPDTNPAQLLSAEATGGTLNRITLTFDEALDPTAATALAHYDVAGLALLSATLGADGKTVVLQTSQQQKGTVYSLALAGLKDRSAAGNPLTASRTVTSTVSYRQEVLADTPARYWRFEETEGSAAASDTAGGDPSTTATFQNGEFAETPSLLAADPSGHAAALVRDFAQWLLPPNGAAINSAGPYSKKTVELWFQAASLPPPDATGLQATAGLWEQGAATRNLGVYLWRNPESADENTVSLVFHAFNNSSDGPGSPFGLTGAPAAYVEYPGIEAEKTYHVAAVFNGDATGTAGELILYVNGREAGRVGGIGQLYAHTGDVQIGQGNGVIHTGENGTWGSFDGVIDEVTHYTAALPADRVQAHYFIGSGADGVGAVSIGAASSLGPKTVPENQPVSFSVAAEGAGPFAYQWFRNGAALEGQTQATLHLLGAAAEAGSYTVKVANQTHKVTGGPAVLTIIADTTAPAVQAGQALAGGINRITLDFSEPLDPATATAPGTYSINGLAVESAELSADGRRVTLLTAAQTPGTVYALAIAGLKDRSAAGNPLHTTLQLISSADYPDIVLADQPVRYWRFEETEVDETTGLAAAKSLASGTAPETALSAAFQSWDGSHPGLGAPGLLASRPSDVAVSLLGSAGQWALAPSHADINTSIRSQRTIEVWFKAGSVPLPGTTGAEAFAGIWEEGGGDRSLGVYLWRDPENANENEAELVFHAFNRLNDGAGSPWGILGTEPVFARHTIQTGQIYHVAAVLDGSRTDTSGSLVLYVNGQEAARAPGAGTIYSHGSDVRIGQGNSRTHDNTTGDLGSFDGTLDELAVYNSALGADRVLAHYQAGIGSGTGVPSQETPPPPALTVSNGVVTLTWTGGGTLQWTDNLSSGQWHSLPSASSPYSETLSSGGHRFFRVAR